MRNAGPEEAQAGIKTAGRNINNYLIKYENIINLCKYMTFHTKQKVMTGFYLLKWVK